MNMGETLYEINVAGECFAAVLNELQFDVPEGGRYAPIIYEVQSRNGLLMVSSVGPYGSSVGLTEESFQKLIKRGLVIESWYEGETSRTVYDDKGVFVTEVFAICPATGEKTFIGDSVMGDAKP